MKKKKISLPLQILLALLLGIVVGVVLGSTGLKDIATNYLKPFGDIFVNLLKFIVVPVVLISMIDGILSMDDMKKVGAVAGRPCSTSCAPPPSPASSVWSWPTCSTARDCSPI